MLISAVVWSALVDAGVVVIPLDADHAELRRGSHRGVLRVVRSPAALSPSDIAEMRHRHKELVLLVVPSATRAVRSAIEAAGWSWLIDDGRDVTGLLRVADQQVAIGARDSETSPHRARPGRVPWGTFMVVRRLVARPWSGQQQLAAVTGVSQPRVSQTLAAMTDHGLVHRTPTGWDVTDFDAVVEWWLHSYPGPRGLRTLWYGLESPVKQAEMVVGLLRDGEHERIAISGDVAADRIAPWRSPRRAVVYAQSGVDLTSAGLTPAGETEATVELIVPQDPGVWPGPTPEKPPGRLPLADPLQILWDVARAPGPDTDEAARHLQRVLRERRQRAAGGQAA